MYETALITGAGRGLGRALALALAREGVAIAAIDLHEEGLRSLDEELGRMGRPCAWAVADVTDGEGMQESIAELVSRLGPIDLLIANAGLGYQTSALTFDGPSVASMIQVNLVGVTNSLACVLPGMIERRRGHVVAISSLASFRGLPMMLGYCASKAGVNALLDGLRVEVRPFGVNVTTVCPGWIRTAMTADIHEAVSLMEPKEAARIILSAVKKKRRFHAFPRMLAWRLRFLSLLPGWLSDWLVGRLFRKMQEKRQAADATMELQEAKVS